MSPNDSFTWYNWNYAQRVWAGLCDLFLNKGHSESHASHYTISCIGAITFAHLWISHSHESIWHIVKLQSHIQKSFAVSLFSCNTIWLYFQYTSSVKMSWFDIPTYFKGTRPNLGFLKNRSITCWNVASSSPDRRNSARTALRKLCSRMEEFLKENEEMWILPSGCTVSPLYVNLQRCERASGSSKEPEPVPSTSGWGKWQLALHLLLLIILPSPTSSLF